jgi:hypothetical protein
MTRGRGIPTAINLSLASVYAVVNLYQFFILPLLLLPKNPRWAWTIAAGVVRNLLEPDSRAIHDLFINRAANGFAGRLSRSCSAPFRILRVSHLLHRLNRLPVEGTEYFDQRKSTRASAAPGYYFQILLGLYVIELVGPLFFFLPRRWLQAFKDNYLPRGTVSAILIQNWLSGDALREIRVDGACAYFWLGLSFYCYGSHWPLLVALVTARAFLISFLDNLYHYETPVGDIFYAKNLRLPAPLSGVLLNFNLHGIHHINPAISWIDLPAAFRAQAAEFQGSYVSAALRQLRGPLALQELPGGTPQ